MASYESVVKLCQVLIFVGVITTAAATLVSWYYSDKISTSKEVEKDIIETERDNLLKQIEAAQRGGDNFCWIRFFPQGTGSAQVTITTNKPTPLYHVCTMITWREFINSSESIDDPDKLKLGPEWMHDVRTFPPILETSPTARHTPIGFVEWKTNGRYTATFMARNGSWRQEYDIWDLPNGDKKHRWRVIRENQERTVLSEGGYIQKPGTSYL